MNPEANPRGVGFCGAMQVHTWPRCLRGALCLLASDPRPFLSPSPGCVPRYQCASTSWRILICARHIASLPHAGTHTVRERNCVARSTARRRTTRRHGARGRRVATHLPWLVVRCRHTHKRLLVPRKEIKSYVLRARRGCPLFTRCGT